MQRIEDIASSIARLEFELELAKTCVHGQTELRVKTASDGSKRYGYQCLRCGMTVITNKKLWQKKTDIEDINSLPPYNETISQTNQQVISALHEQLSEKKWEATYQHFQENYPEYLQSEVWRKKRQLVLIRANNICEGCRVNRATIVHHLTYAHKFDELLFELVAVCKDCHDKIHQDKANDK